MGAIVNDRDASRPSTDRLPEGLTVVVPVYNSEQSLPVLIERLEEVLRDLGRPSEVILVNDSSADRSWQVIQDLARGNDRIRGVNLTRNFGQHNALLCGIRRARYDVTVTMDDDLQNPPEEIQVLLDRLDEGFEVVYGRPEKLTHGFYRNWASRITKIALQQGMGADTARHISAFRAFRTVVRNGFWDFRGPHVSIDVLLTWSASRFATAVVRHDPRKLGQSNYTMRKLIVHALNMITGFTTLPLRLASIVGFGLTIFGVGIFLYVVGRYAIQGSPVQGFTFLASVIAIFSGSQLFALGILGEYLARMHIRLMGQPTYSIEAEVGGGSSK